MATTLSATSIKTTTPVALGTPSAGDPTGNVIPNGGTTIVYIANGATERTLTVAFARTVDGQPVTPKVHTIAPNFVGFLRLGSTADYGANVTLTPSNADLTLKVFQL